MKPMNFTPETVSWKSAFANHGVSASAAHQQIEDLREKNGGVTDDDIVDASRPKRSAMHPLFIWDDKKAAEVQRRDQARLILRSIEITTKEMPEIKQRAYEIVVKQPRRSSAPEMRTLWGTTQQVMADPVSRENLLSSALSQLEALRTRYQLLTELGHVFDAIDKAVGDARKKK